MFRRWNYFSPYGIRYIWKFFTEKELSPMWCCGDCWHDPIRFSNMKKDKQR